MYTCQNVIEYDVAINICVIAHIWVGFSFHCYHRYHPPLSPSLGFGLSVSTTSSSADDDVSSLSQCWWLCKLLTILWWLLTCLFFVRLGRRNCICRFWSCWRRHRTSHQKLLSEMFSSIMASITQCRTLSIFPPWWLTYPHRPPFLPIPSVTSYSEHQLHHLKSPVFLFFTCFLPSLSWFAFCHLAWLWAVKHLLFYSKLFELLLIHGTKPTTNFRGRNFFRSIFMGRESAMWEYNYRRKYNNSRNFFRYIFMGRNPLS